MRRRRRRTPSERAPQQGGPRRRAAKDLGLGRSRGSPSKDFFRRAWTLLGGQARRSEGDERQRRFAAFLAPPTSGDGNAAPRPPLPASRGEVRRGAGRKGSGYGKRCEAARWVGISSFPKSGWVPT